MSITGYTFYRVKNTAKSDASLYDYMSLQRNGVIPQRGNGLSVTTSGLICTINTGQALIQGRLVEVTTQTQITIPANSTGYLCITVDLSKTNTSTGTPGNTDYVVVIGQLSIDFVETLTQDDLFNGGLIYNFNLGSITSDGTTATYTKNWDAYTPHVILPDGAIFGDDVNNYGSTLADNRWYGGTNQDLIIDVPTTRKLIIRNKDTQEVIQEFPGDSNNIFPNGAIFGDSTTDYGSAILDNRWYSDTDNLYIEPQANKMAVVRQVGANPDVFLPIKASRFIGSKDISWSSFTIEGKFSNSSSIAYFKCVNNIVIITGMLYTTTSFVQGVNTNAFTLPLAYRPSMPTNNYLYFPVYYNDNSMSEVRTVFLYIKPYNGECGILDPHYNNAMTYPVGSTFIVNVMFSLL